VNDPGLSILLALVVIPALVSGAIAASVAALLYLQRRQAVFRDFALLVLSVSAYALLDGLLVLNQTLLTNDPPLLIRILAVLEILSCASIIRSLYLFAHSLLALPRRRWLNLLSLLPLAAAILTGISVLIWTGWQFGTAQAVGKVFLLSVFASVGVVGINFLVQRRRIHDQIFKRIVAGSGILLLVFIPVWVLEIFGVIRVMGVYLYLLLWNSAALLIAARAYFQPQPQARTNLTIDAAAAERVVKRFDLSPREGEIAVLHAQGHSSKEIADQLCIAPKTVRNHISNLYAKTGVNQRRDLFQLFM
jgi:DNA-binding CsgD family transcriptional regulator